jgi:two-component system chemotaxis response regulator CheB
MIKVLIVDDSRVTQELLKYILVSDPAIEVVGVASNGAEALKAVQKHHPDLITMDIHMPLVDGFEATRAIMENVPTPIVIVSASTSVSESEFTFRAIEAGALTAVLRPPGIGHPKHKVLAKELIQKVKLMSEIKVVRRISRSIAKPPTSLPSSAEPDIRLIAIGASTGGPPALNKILSGLPSDLPVPVLIVQHISAGFVDGFIDWLGGVSGFPVKKAEHEQNILPGFAYVAPDNYQMGVGRGGRRIILNNAEPENGLRPAVSYLFRTVTQELGAQAVGVLLTGMGVDGALELKQLKKTGAVTIAQDKASSVVFGMPGEAIKLGGATCILPVEGIAHMLVRLANNNGTKTK